MAKNTRIIKNGDNDYPFMRQIAMTYDGMLYYNTKTSKYFKMALNGEYIEVDIVKEKIQPFVDALYNEIGPLFMELAQPQEEQETLEAVRVQEQKDKEIRKQIKGLLAGALLYFANGGTL